MKGHEVVARVLLDRGVDTVFGLIGDGNMHWVAAYDALLETTWCPAWHEAGAVWMAGGYTGASGRVGVATVTMGPGLAQALAAITTLVRTRTPVVIITAEIPAAMSPHSQDAPQAAWVQAAGARYLVAADAAQVAGRFDEALASAAAGTPCVLAIRLTTFDEDTGAPPPPPPAPAGPPPGVVGDVAAAAALLAAAHAPLVIIGRGVLTAGARDAALALGRRIGAAFATTVGGKSALPDEPFDLGLTGMMASPLARDVARAADVVLVLGAGLDQYNTDGATLGTGATIVRVDVRDPAQLWHPPGAAQVSLTGDLPQVLASLTTALTTALPTGPDRVGVRDADLRRRLDDETARRADLTTTPMPDGPNPWAAMAVLSETLPPDAHVVVGIGHFWYFVTPYLSPAPDRRFQFGSGFGLIGQALPLGIGAAVAMAAGQRRPVVVIDGDGSIAMNIQELHSAVRLGIDLLVVVLDNRSYGSEFHKLAVAGLDPAVSNVEDPIDFAALAGALGAVGRTAADLPALRRELGDLVPRHGTRLLHAAIARTPMSEVYQRQHAHPEPSR